MLERTEFSSIAGPANFPLYFLPGPIGIVIMSEVRVLLIADASDERLIVLALLQSNPDASYHVEWAADYDSGLQAIRRGGHDVVLVDYRLDRRDGLELIREATAWNCGAPLILLTGQAGREVDIAAMEAGAADILTKGTLDARQLERAIRYSLRRKQEKVEQQQRRRELEQSNRQLSVLATTDPLTGLANRRRFAEALTEQLSLANRLVRPLSLVLLDIDHFKAYNDAFGHTAGDEALRRIAKILGKGARAYDLAARYGGEEFAVLLPSTDAAEARSFAERLREQITKHAWPMRPVTASLGVGTAGPSGTSGEDLVGLADRALYHSKREGRDRVTHYDDLWADPGVASSSSGHPVRATA